MKYKLKSATISHILSIPFIWMMLVPVVILDIFLFIYQQTALRLYEIKLVERNQYLLMDRQKLKYLTWYDKINCAYCGYANGIFAYASEIAARTEDYWCSIKHKETNKKYYAPKHHYKFIEYGDEKAYKKILNKK
ncbi:MAG: hypothetical protein ACMXX6_00825 [Candidatus Woesearchaeota archaeon]